MIIFPNNFIQLDNFPGYYYNVEFNKLYSCKSGVLKPLMVYTSPGRWNNWYNKPYYKISVKGVRRSITVERLMKLQYPPSTAQHFPQKDDND